MAHVEVSAGTIEYDDTGGNGPVVVFVHGLLMDGPSGVTLWRTCATIFVVFCRRYRWVRIEARCDQTRTCHSADLVEFLRNSWIA